MFEAAHEALEGLLVALRGSDVSPEQVKAAHQLHRLAERVLTEAVGGLVRSGAIEGSGYRKKPPAAVADLTRDDFSRCRRLLEVAEAVCATEEQPARLPEVAARFAAGETDVEHAAVAAQILRSPAAEQLTPQARQQAETRIAALATGCTLGELRIRGKRVIAELAPPGSEPEPEPNELRLTRLPGGGGKLSGGRVRWAV